MESLNVDRSSASRSVSDQTAGGESDDKTSSRHGLSDAARSSTTMKGETSIISHLRNANNKIHPTDVRNTTAFTSISDSDRRRHDIESVLRSRGITTIDDAGDVSLKTALTTSSLVAAAVAATSVADKSSNSISAPSMVSKDHVPGTNGKRKSTTTKGAVSDCATNLSSGTPKTLKTMTSPSSLSSSLTDPVRTAGVRARNTNGMNNSPLLSTLLQQQLSRELLLTQVALHIGTPTPGLSTVSSAQLSSSSQPSQVPSTAPLTAGSQLLSMNPRTILNLNSNIGSRIMGATDSLQQLKTQITNPLIDPRLAALASSNSSMMSTVIPSYGTSSSAAISLLLGPPQNSQGPTRKRGPFVLYMECDEESLSEYQCTLRKQIELFAADAMEAKSSVQGRTKQIQEGQVGIRCRHCAHIPVSSRNKGSMYFPTKLDRIYQAAQNLSAFHLCGNCQNCPEDVRRLITILKERKSPAGGGKHYWADAVRCLGVIEDSNGLRFR